jgi:hypothetical protein
MLGMFLVCYSIGREMLGQLLGRGVEVGTWAEWSQVLMRGIFFGAWMFFVPRWINSRTPLFKPWKDLRLALSLAAIGGIFSGVVATFEFRLFHWPLSLVSVMLDVSLRFAYSREGLIPAKSGNLRISYGDPLYRQRR